MEFIRVNISSNLFESIQATFRSNDHYVLLAGLGGTTGTYLVGQLSSWLQQNQHSFMTICSLPFTFQGTAMRSRAGQAAAQLTNMPGFHCIDLNELGEKYCHLSVGEVFKRVDAECFSIFAKATFFIA